MRLIGKHVYSIGKPKFNEIIQSLLFIGIIFLLELGYYKKLLSISPAQWLLMLLGMYSILVIALKKTISLKHMVFIGAYMIYALVAHGFSTTDFINTVALLSATIALLNRRFDMDRFWSLVEVGAVIATMMIIVQTVSYYVFGYPLDLFPVSLVDEWRLSTDTTLHLDIVYNGLMRLAAFFAEPSHFVHFVSPMMFQYMLTEEKRRKKFKLLVFVSIGIVLTTSGMGIFTVATLWLFYVLKMLGSKKIKYLFYGLALLITFILVVVLLFNYNAAFQASILRIFMSSNIGSSAITGRTAGIEELLNILNGRELWFGIGEVENRIAGGFIGGTFQVLYTNGIIGVALYLMIYLYAAIKLPCGKRWHSLYLIGISFVAGINSIYFLLYYIFTIYSGFSKASQGNMKKSLVQ